MTNPSIIHEGQPEVASLAVSLHDRPGALDRVIGVTRRQGCAVLGLTLVPTDRGGLMSLTLTVRGGSPLRLAQQLGRLVDVVAVRDTSAHASWTTRRADAPPADFHFQADGMSDLLGGETLPNEPTTRE